MKNALPVVTAVLSGLWAMPALSAPLPVQDSTQSYTIIDQEVRAVLADFSESLNIPISISDEVSGAVRRVTGEFTPTDFLHHLALNNEFSWYFDGRTLHITPLPEDRTVILQMGDVSVDELNRTLEELEIADARYPVIAGGDHGLARVSGPPRYIELLQETFQAMSPPDRITTPADEARPLMIIQGDDKEIMSTGEP